MKFSELHAVELITMQFHQTLAKPNFHLLWYTYNYHVCLAAIIMTCTVTTCTYDQTES